MRPRAAMVGWIEEVLLAMGSDDDGDVASYAEVGSWSETTSTDSEAEAVRGAAPLQTGVVAATMRLRSCLGTGRLLPWRRCHADLKALVPREPPLPARCHQPRLLGSLPSSALHRICNRHCLETTRNPISIKHFRALRFHEISE